MRGVRAVLSSHREAGAASRYETFVIRLWVQPDAAVDHGEIRHIGTNRTVRFRELERAIAFIGETIAREVAPGADLAE